MLDGRYVKGFLVVTKTRIIRLCGEQVPVAWSLSQLSGFFTETLYGSVTFGARLQGADIHFCHFISGKSLPRYTVLSEACETLAKRARGETAPPLPSGEIKAKARFCPTCDRPFLLNTTICPFCMKRGEAFRKIWQMTRGMRWLIFTPVMFALFGILIRFTVPYFQKNLINRYITNRGIDLYANGVFRSFVLIMVAIITLTVVQRVLHLLQMRVSAVVGNRFTRKLRVQLFDKIESLSLNSIQSKTTGDLIGRINGDVNVVQHFMTDTLPQVVTLVLSLVCGITLVFILNPTIALLIFLPLPLVALAISRLMGLLRDRNQRSWFAGRRTNLFLQDALSGIRVVKSFGREEAVAAEYDRITRAQATINERNDKLFDLLFRMIDFLTKLGFYGILLYGNRLLFAGSLGVGDLNQYTSYSGYVYESLWGVTSMPRQISRFMTSLSKVLEIFEEVPEVMEAEAPRHADCGGAVAFRGATFGYESFSPVVHDITFDVRPGESIGLVGHSGSGKSTLINLLMRMYDVDGGAIEVGGVDIREIAQESLRSQMGVVLQETYLFSGSIRDNIAYAKPNATCAEIIDAARQACAHDFIMKLPDGYDTYVGERGYTLSGGERQRLAIARALISNPKILILDEATAALDAETEAQIQTAITRASRGRTTVAIAHRLSTLRNADRLVVLEQGRIAEIGSHRELLDKRGIYYRLVMAQTAASLKVTKQQQPKSS